MLTEIETYYDAAPEGWDRIVSKLGGNLFHSTLWAEYQQQTKNLQPIYLLLRDETGTERAGALAFLQQSRFPLASLVVRDFLLPTHPFIFDQNNSICTRFVKECERLGKKLGCSRITIDSFMSSSSPFVPSDHAYMGSARLEFLVDLKRDADSLWGGIAKDQRERIKRLKRQGVIVEVGTDYTDVQGLRLARETTQAKRERRGQGYELSSEENFYKWLHSYLVKTGAGRLFVARYEGRVIGALFFVTFNKKACSMFSGSTDVGYKLGVQCGLFWGAVEAFKSEGFRELNRGGIPASAAGESHPLHGIYLFKLRLGATPLVCHSGEKILSPFRDRLVQFYDRIKSLTVAH
jgi:peptidoglycan pentaglycine glycine transferase (the first glycine)